MNTNNQLIDEYTKDTLFTKVRALENAAFSIIGVETFAKQYDQIMGEVDVLTGIAREKGWL